MEHSGSDGSVLSLPVSRRSLGYGKDWREYENIQGFTHFEELLLYQPARWRHRARDYIFSHDIDPSRESSSIELRTLRFQVENDDGTCFPVKIAMTTPVLMVMFHPEIDGASRLAPLNFLLAYGAPNPLPPLIRQLNLDQEQEEAFLRHISPLDYFFHFQQNVAMYRPDGLAEIAKVSKIPSLRFMNELDFSKIIGQRLAKEMIRQQVVTYLWDRCRGEKQSSAPLSMIFAGPSGNGKTELAQELAELLNVGGDSSTFFKVDCGKMQHSTEVFGLSGAYQGSQEGSALNNFVVRMSRDPSRIGVVLLDEFEKSQKEVVEGFYQVLDNGEWTNKQLNDQSGSQTSVVPCSNVIFIMTVNAADDKIVTYANDNPGVYIDGQKSMQQHKSRLEHMIQTHLQHTHPFTKAFIGRLDAFIPFLPMCGKRNKDANPLEMEMMAVAKVLIENEMKSLQVEGDFLQVKQSTSSNDKHKMADAFVGMANPETGVRSIQKLVRREMGKRVMHEYLLVNGGVSQGSEIRYTVSEEDASISFRTVGFRSGRNDKDRHGESNDAVENNAAGEDANESSKIE